MGIQFNGKRISQILFGGREVSEVRTWDNSLIARRLDTPDGIYVNGRDASVSWNVVDGADYYEYRIDGGEIQSNGASTIAAISLGQSIEIRAVGDGFLDSPWSDFYSCGTEKIAVTFGDSEHLPWRFKWDCGGVTEIVTYEEVEWQPTRSFEVPKGAAISIDFIHPKGILKGGGEAEHTPFSMYSVDGWEVNYDTDLGDVRKYACLVLGLDSGHYSYNDGWNTTYPADRQYKITMVLNKSDGSTSPYEVIIGMRKVSGDYGTYSYKTVPTSIAIPYGCSITFTELSHTVDYGDYWYTMSNWTDEPSPGDNIGVSSIIGYDTSNYFSQKIGWDDHAAVENSSSSTVVIYEWYGG